MYRDAFPFFNFNPNTIYFDNAATSLILQDSLNVMNLYYTRNPYNINRSGYIQSMAINYRKNIIANKVAKFIGAQGADNIVFTSGATEGLNMVVFGYFKPTLRPNDEVILTHTEHASNVLPWLKLAQENDLKIHYAELTKNGQIDIEKLRLMINSNTKVISIASVTNTNGDARKLHEIGQLCLENNIRFVVDHAQGAAHYKIDVQFNNIDFLVFSGHKIYGPKGIGILYINEKIIEPLKYGGGMNLTFDEHSYELNDDNSRYYAGTENVAAILGLEPVIDFLNENIKDLRSIETKLSEYLRARISNIKGIKILNKSVKSPITLFTVDEWLSMDIVDILASNNILIRGGHHCAKMTNKLFGTTDTCRVSLSFYNTVEEIDKFAEALEEIICKKNVLEETAQFGNVERQTAR